jgi:hypothetical protein
MRCGCSVDGRTLLELAIWSKEPAQTMINTLHERARNRLTAFGTSDGCEKKKTRSEYAVRDLTVVSPLCTY